MSSTGQFFQIDGDGCRSVLAVSCAPYSTVLADSRNGTRIFRCMRLSLSCSVGEQSRGRRAPSATGALRVRGAGREDEVAAAVLHDPVEGAVDVDLGDRVLARDHVDLALAEPPAAEDVRLERTPV